MTPKEIAAKRGWQTLMDGAIVVAIMAGIAPLIGSIGSADGWVAWLADWQSWTWGVFQGALIAGGTACVAWLRRRFVDKPTETV